MYKTMTVQIVIWTRIPRKQDNREIQRPKETVGEVVIQMWHGGLAVY